jgi:thiamine-phosphate pyrophosphorylase
MPRIPSTPFLYPILDDNFSVDLAKDAVEVMRAGIEILQLRAKNTSTRRVARLVQEIAALAGESNVLLIINDYVDVAMLTDVGGVHLGQEDFPVLEARRLLPTKIIGTSTHTREEFDIANSQPVDYIAIGPIYRTHTKQGASKPQGLSFIKKVRPLTSKPLVAIGGLEPQHFEPVFEAGANGIALISAIYQPAGIYDSVSRMQERVFAYRLRKSQEKSS